MAPPKIGPLTSAMGKAKKGERPAIIVEWDRQLQHPGQFVFMWAAATKRRANCLSWLWFFVHTGDERPEGDFVTQTPAANVERMLSPLAQEGRVRIMQALWRGPLTASGLSEATGFRGGALYHHLKELKYAAYVADEDGSYRLTDLGHQLLLTVTCIASKAIEDRGEEGLAVATDWGKGT